MRWEVVASLLIPLFFILLWWAQHGKDWNSFFVCLVRLTVCWALVVDLSSMRQHEEWEMSSWQLGMVSGQKIAKGSSSSVPPTDLLILMTLSFVVYQEGKKNHNPEFFHFLSLRTNMHFSHWRFLFILFFRIYVDLPDAENRLKILKIFLTQENLETGFQFDKLAKETEGYSGSDLKVLVHSDSSICGT